MPSKFKKALGAVKDHTSIGLAKVSKTATGSFAAHLDLLVLKATTHDENPVDEHHVDEILALTAASPAGAAACVHSLSRRIERTRDWAVAAKCLHVVLRGTRDGGPHFPREASSAILRGARLVDLAAFRDDSAGASPWDYTAFVRTLALYVSCRLDCIVREKLSARRLATAPRRLCDLKPPAILDRIGHWQALLDRAIATRPNGPARRSRLVHATFHLVVRDSFDLYRDVSAGLKLILDGFFELHRRTCAAAHETCARAARQFDELALFYDACRGIGVGRRSEYPDVQKIPDRLLDTLDRFVKAGGDLARSPPPPPPSTRSGSKSSMRMFAAAPSVVQSRARSPEGRTLSDFVGFVEGFEEHTDPHDKDAAAGHLEMPGRGEEPDSDPSHGATRNEETHDVDRRVDGDGDNTPAATSAPTFCAGDVDTTPRGSDPFASPCEAASPTDDVARQRAMEREQHMWLQRQSKIIASRNLAP